VTGERLNQAGWFNPSLCRYLKSGSEAEFTSSSGGVRAPSVTRNSGAVRAGMMRNHSDSSQVTQERFGPEWIAVTQRVNGCYCASARGAWLWRFHRICQRKDAERRDKMSMRIGKETALGKSQETFQNAGDVKNGTAGLWAKSNLRVKRSDPWHRANVSRYFGGAVPALNGKDAERSHKRVFTWFASRRCKRQPKRAERPHSKSSGRKALDGPANEAAIPFAAENSVGKPAA